MESRARLVEQLDLEHYTLHGLRKTGPSALKMLGFESRAIRSLTGHTSDKTSNSTMMACSTLR